MGESWLQQVNEWKDQIEKKRREVAGRMRPFLLEELAKIVAQYSVELCARPMKRIRVDWQLKGSVDSKEAVQSGHFMIPIHRSYATLRDKIAAQLEVADFTVTLFHKDGTGIGITQKIPINQDLSVIVLIQLNRPPSPCVTQ